MKKTITIIFCFLILISMFGCSKNDLDASAGFEAIDSALIDIDGDGIKEKCTMSYGPTSGLFTVVITASVKGEIKYRNAFNLSYGTLSFNNENGVSQIIRDETPLDLYVENNRIVIAGLDPEYEGYWGGSEWNYDLRTKETE